TEAEAQRQLATQAGKDVPWSDPFLQEVHTLKIGLAPSIDRAVDLLSSGQIAEAAEALSKIVRQYPDSERAHFFLGKVLLRLRGLEQAEVELHHAIRLDRRMAEAHFLLGRSQTLRKDYAEAERSYQRTLELKPTHGLAHYNLGECRLQQGQRAKALEAF